MATAKKVGTNLLILWIAAGVILGAGAMYLLTIAFPGTFVIFRGGVTSTPTTTTTTTSTTSTANGQNPNQITSQPLKSVELKGVVLTNSQSGGKLIFNLVGETVGTKLIAETADILQLDDSFIQGFSNPPTTEEVQALLGDSIAAINERAKSELGATELKFGKNFIDSLFGASVAGNKTFTQKLDELLGGTGDGNRAKGFLLGLLIGWALSGGI